jgi:hypothetical protein
MENIKKVLANPVVKDGIDKIVDSIDANKDGKVTLQEAKVWFSSSKNIKFLLYILGSILIGPLIDWISGGINTGIWIVDGLFDMASVIIPAIILGYYFKGLLDLADKEKKEMIEEIRTLKDNLQKNDLKHIGEVNELNLKLKQFEGIIETKNMEIEWLRNGYSPKPLKQ